VSNGTSANLLRGCENGCGKENTITGLPFLTSGMEHQADFFLSAAAEVSGDMAIPRACWAKGRLRNSRRDDYLLVEVEPPIIGQPYGLGARTLQMIISSRYRGFSLFPVSDWPCDVYVSRILDDRVVNTSVVEEDQIELMAWGRIYRTLAEANAEAKRL